MRYDSSAPLQKAKLVLVDMKSVGHWRDNVWFNSAMVQHQVTQPLALVVVESQFYLLVRFVINAINKESICCKKDF